MGISRSQVQWQDIFKEEENSGLTIVDYCRLHEIATATFYACRKKLYLSQSPFIQEKITQQVEVISNTQPICLKTGNVSLSLPSTIPTHYLGQLYQRN